MLHVVDLDLEDLIELVVHVHADVVKTQFLVLIVVVGRNSLDGTNLLLLGLPPDKLSRFLTDIGSFVERCLLNLVAEAF